MLLQFLRLHFVDFALNWLAIYIEGEDLSPALNKVKICQGLPVS